MPLMSTSRRFLVASSLARLIGRERNGQRVVEGYFPDQAGRALHVRVEDQTAGLILINAHAEISGEQTTEMPLAQAEALLEVTAGQLSYVHTSLPVGSHDVSLYQIMSPGRLDLVSIVFASKEDAGGFEPPAWFGPEVTVDSAYQDRAMALKGLPALPDVPLSDAALHSLLDSLDSPIGKEQEHLLLSERPQPSTSAAAALSHPEDEDASDLDIEDSVIRELARSLRPVRQ
jgi:CYTH domain-containing protein